MEELKNVITSVQTKLAAMSLKDFAASVGRPEEEAEHLRSTAASHLNAALVVFDSHEEKNKGK